MEGRTKLLLLIMSSLVALVAVMDAAPASNIDEGRLEVSPQSTMDSPDDLPSTEDE